MSVCTHVAGVVRLDEVRVGEPDIPDFDKIFGKEVKYGDSEETWRDAYANPEKYLPLGSNGTLRKSIWINPDRSETASYTVTIFGDLRDENEPEKIIDWFKGICDNDELAVRDAVIHARCSDKSIRWSYK